MSNNQKRTRPTTIEEYSSQFEGLFTEHGRNIGKNYQPDPTDVIITPYGKSGTTWLQQIVHGLRTRGDMDFDDISRVVPWLDLSYDLGIDIYAPQKASPRAFKSHLGWDNIPKGGRYIVSIRNPKDVLVSLFRFSEGWFFEPNSISIIDYAHFDFLNPEPGEGYWNHLLSWWPQRDSENVLLLSYEAMKRDQPKIIRTVADFIGIPLDDALFDIVNRQSSFEFMKQHQDRFDDSIMREYTERKCNLPTGSDSTKVREGKVGSHKHELPQEIVKILDVRWQELILPATGFKDYDALQQAIVSLTA